MASQIPPDDCSFFHNINGKKRAQGYTWAQHPIIFGLTLADGNKKKFEGSQNCLPFHTVDTVIVRKDGSIKFKILGSDT